MTEKNRAKLNDQNRGKCHVNKTAGPYVVIGEVRLQLELGPIDDHHPEKDEVVAEVQPFDANLIVEDEKLCSSYAKKQPISR